MCIFNCILSLFKRNTKSKKPTFIAVTNFMKVEKFMEDANFMQDGTDIIWEDTTTPIIWNGFSLIKMNAVNMTAFPPILEMNHRQNLPPYQNFQITLNLSGNLLPVNNINSILVDLDNTSSGFSFFSGTINLSGQTPPAPPSGAGITAKNNLIANFMTVITD
jgi:hypothetical protein